uniref:hypothetical protein n=1 Tax=Salmonella sp. s54836 TaxID=3159673 RepID=UPI003980BBE5
RMAAGQGQRVFNNLYIKGYQQNMSDEELRPILEPFGTILSIKVLPQGYGFCSFRETDAALKAVTELHEKQTGPHGEKLYVQRAQRKRERDAELKRKFEQIKQQKRQESKGVNLYVKNLEDEISDE